VPSLLIYEVSRQTPFPPLALVPNETPAAIPAGVSPCPHRDAGFRMTAPLSIIREEAPEDCGHGAQARVR